MGLLRDLLRSVDVPKAEGQADGKRLCDAEDSIAEIKAANEHHLKLISLVFSSLAGLVAVVAICITILSVFARYEAGKSLHASQIEVKEAIKEMERKFDALAGAAMQKAVVQIETASGQLDMAAFKIGASNLPQTKPIFLHNVGDKSTEAISIRAYLSEEGGDLRMIINSGMLEFAWDRTPSNEPDYPVAFRYNSDRSPVVIGAKETWGIGAIQVPLHFTQTNGIECKLVVFYGAEQPAEATFTFIGE